MTCHSNTKVLHYVYYYSRATGSILTESTYDPSEIIDPYLGMFKNTLWKAMYKMNV